MAKGHMTCRHRVHGSRGAATQNKHTVAPSLNHITHAPEEDLTGEMLLITLAARVRH